MKLSDRTKIKIVANAKFGTDTPNKEMIRTEKSVFVFRFTPAIMPSGIAIIHEMKAAKMVNSNVIAKRLKISGRISAPVRMDTPKSPTSTPDIHVKYCSYNGILRPNLLRSAANDSSVALGPENCLCNISRDDSKRKENNDRDTKQHWNNHEKPSNYICVHESHP